MKRNWREKGDPWGQNEEISQMIEIVNNVDVFSCMYLGVKFPYLYLKYEYKNNKHKNGNTTSLSTRETGIGFHNRKL